MNTVAPRRSFHAAPVVATLLHVPLVLIALLMLRYGWIVQILAMGCDTGAVTCRPGLRGIGEVLATAGPSAALVASVVVSVARARRGLDAVRIPVIGIVAAFVVIAVAGGLVLAATTGTRV